MNVFFLQKRMLWAELPQGSLISWKSLQFSYSVYFCFPGAEFIVLRYVKVVVLPNILRPGQSSDWEYLWDFLIEN